MSTSFSTHIFKKLMPDHSSIFYKSSKFLLLQQIFLFSNKFFTFYEKRNLSTKIHFLIKCSAIQHIFYVIFKFL